MGFAYGNQIAGQNNATSYLWTYTTEKSALAFSQVFIRPKLTTASYPAIPAAGLPASTIRPMMSSETSPTTPWGVTGILGAASELKMEAETFAQIGNIMYVGGAFQYVQKGPNPTPDEKIAQPWLAGFDVNTGEWLSSFRPSPERPGLGPAGHPGRQAGGRRRVHQRRRRRDRGRPGRGGSDHRRPGARLERLGAAG